MTSITMPNKKILIVEDDPEVRLALHVRLKANHYDHVFAADGMSAVLEARKHQPDLILLDLGLPCGDGFLVMEKLKAVARLAAIPVIVLSARDYRANEERVRAAGALAFLQKPVDNDELFETMRKILDEDALKGSGSRLPDQ
jgi:DNA-binding response OmpR family regulator